MNSEEFYSMLDKIKGHLEKEKVFIQNPLRVKEVDRAMKIINTLFPDSISEIKNDPLQTGAIILSVDTPDMVVRGQEELTLFAELTSLVDNFEIYAKENNQIHFGAVIKEVFIYLKEQN